MAKKNVQRKHSSGPASLTKLFFQILQCLHHLAICKAQSEGQVTKAFKSKLKELNRFMRPAQENSNLREDILAVNKSWMTEMTKLLQDHYSSRISELLDLITSSKPTLDAFQQNYTNSLQWARRNFGTKIKQATFKEFRDLVHTIRPGLSKQQQSASAASKTSRPTVSKTQHVGKYSKHMGRSNSIHVPNHTTQSTSAAKHTTHSTSAAKHTTQSTSAAKHTTQSTSAAKHTTQSTSAAKHTTQSTSVPNHNIQLNDRSSGWDHVNQIRRVIGHLDPLSNFYPCKISWRHQTFNSVEQAYQWYKAIAHDSQSTANKILKCEKAIDCKRIANDELPALNDTWDIHKLDIIYNLLITKGQQCAKFFEELVQSVGYDIVHPVKDAFWGSGKHGEGHEHFSKLLIKARTSLTSDPIHSITDSQAVSNTQQQDTSLHQAQVSDTSLHQAQVSPEHGPPPFTHTPTQSQTPSPRSPTPPPTRGKKTEHLAMKNNRHQSAPSNITPSPQPASTTPKKAAPPVRRQLLQHASTPAKNTRLATRCNQPTQAAPHTDEPTSPKKTIPATYDNLLKHNKTGKGEWYLATRLKPVLVLGDSNIARITELPNDNITMESYPGGTFRNIRDMMQRAFNQGVDTSNYKHVILSVGVNSKTNKAITVQAEFPKFLRMAKKLFPTAEIYITEVHFSSHLPRDQCANLDDLNSMIRNQMICPHISRHPDHGKFIGDNIHWTEATANTILQHWIDKINLN